MNLKHWLLATAIGAVSFNETSAQNKLSIENIRSISLRNSGTIVSGEEIKGYFYYYVSIIRDEIVQDESFARSTVVSNGKRFIAYEIVNRLIELKKFDILKILEQGVQPKDRSRGKKHEVWKDAFDIKECRTEKFLCQKMHYMHNNPCHPRWNLAAEPHLYYHSSASQYRNGKVSAYPVTDYLKFITMYYPKE